MKTYTKLANAIREPNLEKVLRIARKGADLCDSDDRGRTLLHWAASEGNPSIVAFLINNNLPIDARTDYDFTPLHLANCGETARLLIGAGADIKATNRSSRKQQWKSLGNCPVHTAVWYERLDVLDVLLEGDSNINCQNLNGMAPIHEAAGYHDAEFLSSIIRRGGDVNILDNTRRSPLHYALENRNNEAVDTLANAGAVIPEDIRPDVDSVLFGNHGT
jgi:ankyrin repeat protein